MQNRSLAFIKVHKNINYGLIEDSVDLFRDLKPTTSWATSRSCVNQLVSTVKRTKAKFLVKSHVACESPAFYKSAAFEISRRFVGLNQLPFIFDVTLCISVSSNSLLCGSLWMSLIAMLFHRFFNNFSIFFFKIGQRLFWRSSF